MSNDRLEVSVIENDGSEGKREIFMSYGLLNALVRIIGDPSRAAALDLDPDLAEQVLIITLIPRNAAGKPTISLEEFEVPGLTPETAYQIFDWVKGSVLDFFVRRLEKTVTSIKDRKEDLQNIGASMSGLGV